MYVESNKHISEDGENLGFTGKDLIRKYIQEQALSRFIIYRKKNLVIYFRKWKQKKICIIGSSQLAFPILGTDVLVQVCKTIKELSDWGDGLII